MSRLDRLPTEVLDEIVFFLGESISDVINFSFCTKSIREELLESNVLVMSSKIASDVRKLRGMNVRRMKAIEKKRSHACKEFEIDKDDKKKRKFDEFTTSNRDKQSILTSNDREEDRELLIQINKAFSIVDYYERESNGFPVYNFEKWLVNQSQNIVNNSIELTNETDAIIRTKDIKKRCARLLRDYFQFECGDEVCNIIVKCVFEKMEYTSRIFKNMDDAYPRYYTNKSEFKIGSDLFSYYSREDERGDGSWQLYYNATTLIYSGDLVDIQLETKSFKDSKDIIFGEHVAKISDSIYLIILLSLIDFRYGETWKSFSVLQRN